MARRMRWPLAVGVVAGAAEALAAVAAAVAGPEDSSKVMIDRTSRQLVPAQS